MKKLTFLLIAVLMLTFAIAGIYAKTNDDSKKKTKVTEANVWTTEDGAKHFKCPVMGSEGVVKESTTFSIVDGKKYYHCCGGCSEKFTSNTAKYLDGFVVPGNVVKIDKEGQHFKCVISGKEGLVTDKTTFSDKDGKRYYFCCPGCKPKFEQKSKEKKSQKS